MSFNGTKTPLKPTGVAKWQVPMQRKENGMMAYCLEGDIKELFIKNFPIHSNRRIMQWFGISHSTTLRFARGTITFSKEGFYLTECEGAECLIFPSKEQRDWSKFEAPWYKKDKKGKFDPKTLNPFDKVLIRRGSENYNVWFPDFVSDPPNGANNETLCMCVGEDIAMVIPYNDETKHLAGTYEKAPEYYRYWEDL